MTRSATIAGLALVQALALWAALGLVSAPAHAESADAAQRSLYIEVAPFKPSGARWDAFSLFGLDARIDGVEFASAAPDPVVCVLSLDGSGAVDCDPRDLRAEPPCLDRYACEFHGLPLARGLYGVVVLDWEPVRDRASDWTDLSGGWSELRGLWDSVDLIAALIVSDEPLRPRSPEWEAATENMKFLLEALIRPATDADRSRLGPPYQNVTLDDLGRGVQTIGGRITLRRFE